MFRNGRPIACWLGWVLILSGAVAAEAVDPAQPAVSQEQLPEAPEPNPADPVNYVKWINDTFGAAIQDNAAEDYQKAS